MNPNELIDLVLSDAPAHEISDGIKDILMQKSSERLEIGRPVVAADLFGDSDELVDDEEVTQEDPTEEENG
tara:strand:+ start:646 stop:858 length:213 start_codon:yes stop_codon:yes gene_type:complete